MSVFSKGGISIFIGARILKTGFAVTIAVLICELLNIQPSVFAAISVVLNMQPSVSKSLKNASEQVLVHILAVVIAVLLGFTIGANPLTMGFAVVILIGLCIKIKRPNGINLGVVSIIFVLDSPLDQFYYHVFIRSLAVLIGLGVALLINTFIMPPKNKERMLQALGEFYSLSANYFLDSLHIFINSHEFADYQSEEPVELKNKQLEVAELLEHARNELSQDDNPAFIERFFELSRGFVERGQIIDEMTVLRVKRRTSADTDIPAYKISPEFTSILALLSKGEDILEDLVKKLSGAFSEGKAYEYMPIDEVYWKELSRVIDVWQDKFTGVYYLRSLMEVSVVATEISWGARRMKALLNLNHQTNIPHKGV